MRMIGNMLAQWHRGLVGRMKAALGNNSGLATLETVLLIAVLIALVLMFKDTIVDFVDGILNNISGQSSVFDPASIAP